MKCTGVHENDCSARGHARQNWTYSTEFATPSDDREALLLVAQSLDTLATVRLNGHVIASSTNMHVRLTAALPAALLRRGAPNALRVSFLCLITRLWSYLYRGLYGGLYERAHIIMCFPPCARRRAQRPQRLLRRPGRPRRRAARGAPLRLRGLLPLQRHAVPDLRLGEGPAVGPQGPEPLRLELGPS
jgi:hypothetical protein